jgi:hypothetical protein
MTTAEQTAATVARHYNGWTGQTSTGRTASLKDGNAWWFATDYAGRLNDDEQRALDVAAMKAIRGS